MVAAVAALALLLVNNHAAGPAIVEGQAPGQTATTTPTLAVNLDSLTGTIGDTVLPATGAGPSVDDISGIPETGVVWSIELANADDDGADLVDDLGGNYNPSSLWTVNASTGVITRAVVGGAEASERRYMHRFILVATWTPSGGSEMTKRTPITVTLPVENGRWNNSSVIPPFSANPVTVNLGQADDDGYYFDAAAVHQSRRTTYDFNGEGRDSDWTAARSYYFRTLLEITAGEDRVALERDDNQRIRLVLRDLTDTSPFSVTVKRTFQQRQAKADGTLEWMSMPVDSSEVAISGANEISSEVTFAVTVNAIARDLYTIDENDDGVIDDQDDGQEALTAPADIGDSIIYTIETQSDAAVSGGFKRTFGLSNVYLPGATETTTDHPFKINSQASGEITLKDPDTALTVGDYRFTVIVAIARDGTGQNIASDHVDITLTVTPALGEADFVDDAPTTGYSENADESPVTSDMAGENAIDLDDIVTNPASRDLTFGVMAITSAADAATETTGVSAEFELNDDNVLQVKDTIEVSDTADENVYRLQLSVNDGAGVENTHNITVTVRTREGVAPSAIGQEVTIPESTAPGKILDITVSGATAPFTIVGTQELFEIKEGDELHLVGAAGTTPLDYETDAVHIVNVVGSGGGIDDVKILTVNVTDVDEKPVEKPASTPTPVAADGIQAQALTGDTTCEGVPLIPATGDDAAPPNACVKENAQVGQIIGSILSTDPEGDDSTITYRVWDGAAASGGNDALTGDDLTEAMAAAAKFSVNSAGQISVAAELEADAEVSDDAKIRYTLYVLATDGTAKVGDTDEIASTKIDVTIGVDETNDTPEFVNPMVAIDVPETNSETTPQTQVGDVLATYTATDGDNDALIYVLRDARNAKYFDLEALPDNSGAELKVKLPLDYEDPALNPRGVYSVEIEAQDGDSQGQILVTVTVDNVNDNAPRLNGLNSLSIPESAVSGTPIGNPYTATDADGDQEIVFELGGASASMFELDQDTGVLKTKAPLDYERQTTHSLTITATDNGKRAGSKTSDPLNVTVMVTDAPDAEQTIGVSMANPVPGKEVQGNPNSALADTRSDAYGAPGDLPANVGDGPAFFVKTSDASWNTVLRIEITSPSANTACGDALNECVFVELEGDESDDKIKLRAYRHATTFNKFVAAVMPVEGAGTPDGDSTSTDGDGDVYKHTDGTVARISVDEEDKIVIKFNNRRSEISIDNEAPEFGNFTPEHETSVDSGEVDYTFTLTDSLSGVPEAEDLPDSDGDANYTPVVALISGSQCYTVRGDENLNTLNPDNTRKFPTGLSYVAGLRLFEGMQIACSGSTELRTIQDDNDFSEIDNGWEVSTELVLASNRKQFVTFIGCDAAGNCLAFDPDENNFDEALVEITIDNVDPKIAEARTGVMWDSTDNKYDDDRSFVHVLFDDASELNPDTIEADDFDVEGHVVKRVLWYDPDDGDLPWTVRGDGTTTCGSDCSRFSTQAKYRNHNAIQKSVFIELEDELEPDETPDVAVVPNGVEDAAGNEQDSDEKEADDWIAPKFVVESIVSPRTTSQSQVLAGEDDRVVLMITSDERIKTTKPGVEITYVNAPDGCVNTNGVDGAKGTIRLSSDVSGKYQQCASSATGSRLNTVIKKDSNNQWTATVDKPTATGYYNIYITGDDRSAQSNRGSEGVSKSNIKKDFFERDGDVNEDDAVFFEGDVNLPKPDVVVSGVKAGDTDPTVEIKSPLFIELDFSKPFQSCNADATDDDNCVAETKEYAKDNFDSVTVTMFELNGVDLTDQVKTTDDETFLVALSDIEIGDQTLKVQAVDQAGNTLDDTLEIDFEVEERDPFSRRLEPGWNLVSLPGEPMDSAIASVFSSDIEVKTVYTYDPVVPGGWQVAVRESLDGEWQGDLTNITAERGYWVLSDAIQDLEVVIPRIAGGAVGSGTPIQPPSIAVYAGWNLIPVIDITGDALDDTKSISAREYLQSLDDGLDLARVLGYDTITNQWSTVLAPESSSATDGSLQIGSAYWVFVRESGQLVPGGRIN